MNTFIELTILVGIIVIVVLYVKFLAFPLLKGAPYVPISSSNLELLVDLAKVNDSDYVVDLGSGDGRVVIAFAKKGCKVDGYEINPLLVRNSRKKLRAKGVENLATIYEKDFWDQDLSKYDVVALFQVPYVMNKLKDKLLKELKPGSRIISYSFKIPGLSPQKVLGNIYLYKV